MEPKLQLPLGLRTRLTLGVSMLMLLTSMCRRQRELTRRVATTVGAVSAGSLPKAGSSSTTKFSMTMPGVGSRRRCMDWMCTVRPRLAETLATICRR